MTENMKRFLEKISGDRELAEKLSRAEKDALIAEAEDMGIELTDADFTPEENAMSEDELGTVAGGGQCWCAAAGGGTKDETIGDKACGCVAYGQGNDKNGDDRCACILGGSGVNGQK